MSPTGTPNRVSLLLTHHEIPKQDLAEAFGIGIKQVSKYVCGARRLTDEQRITIRAKYPDIADELIRVFDQARNKPKRDETRTISLADTDPTPIEYITITEWKARYGAPGSGGSLDATHRAIGFTRRYELLEPDYCEDVEEAA